MASTIGDLDWLLSEGVREARMFDSKGRFIDEYQNARVIESHHCSQWSLLRRDMAGAPSTGK